MYTLTNFTVSISPGSDYYYLPGACDGYVLVRMPRNIGARVERVQESGMCKAAPVMKRTIQLIAPRPLDDVRLGCQKQYMLRLNDNNKTSYNTTGNKLNLNLICTSITGMRMS